MEKRLRRTAGFEGSRSQRKLRIAIGLSPVFLLVFLVLTDERNGSASFAPEALSEEPLARVAGRAEQGGSGGGPAGTAPQKSAPEGAGEIIASLARTPAAKLGSLAIARPEPEPSEPVFEAAMQDDLQESELETVPQAVWSPESQGGTALGSAEIEPGAAAALGPAPAERWAALGRIAAGTAEPGSSIGFLTSEGIRNTQPSPAPGPGVSSARIVLHYNSDGQEAARTAAALLTRAGFGRTEMQQVPLRVSRTNVRYFHEQNRWAAAAITGILRTMGDRSELKDFTHYSPRPSPGTIEVWLRE